jgi:class 3 adenylate cyclase
MFDRITSHFGVYKVENIADTFMCCGGLGLEQEQNYTPSNDCPPEHPSIRIARAALAMRQASEYFNWRWPDGSPVTLKIGIHSGSVNAGVIGTRSYSYHLFGDAVNTASRMCSHSLPGHICLSKTAVKHIRSINKSLPSLSPLSPSLSPLSPSHILPPQTYFCFAVVVE